MRKVRSKKGFVRRKKKMKAVEDVKARQAERQTIELQLSIDTKMEKMKKEGK